MSTNAYRKCAKCGATPAQDRLISYHRFPKPGKTNIERVRAWAKFCWPEQDWTSVDALTMIYKSNKVLCRRHFQDNCYTDSSKTHLQKFSVPTKSSGLAMEVTRNEPAVAEHWEHLNILVEQQPGVMPSQSSQNTQPISKPSPSVDCQPGSSSCGAYMHRFPHFEKRKELFESWVSIVGDKMKEKDPLKIYRNKRICDYHFSHEQKVANHRLMSNSVPLINLNGVFLSSNISIQLEHNYCISGQINMSDNLLHQPSTSQMNIQEEEQEKQQEPMDMDDERLSSHSQDFGQPIHSTESTSFIFWKHKLQKTFNSVKFCGFCMENDKEMLPIDDCLEVAVKEVFNGQDVLLSTYSCKECSEKLIQAHLFIYATKQVAEIMNGYANNLQSQMTDLPSQLAETAEGFTNVLIISKNVKAGEFDPEIFCSEIKHKEEYVIELNRKNQQDGDEENNNNELHNIADDILNENFNYNEENYFELPTDMVDDTLDRIMYECTFCSKYFTTNKCLRTHYKKVHSKVDCLFCPMVVSKRELVHHLRKEHENHNYFVCKPCNMAYYSKADLIIHMKKSHTLQHKQLSRNCIMCLKNIKLESSKQHICEFSCPDCSKVPCIHHKYLISFRDQIFKFGKAKCLDCEYKSRSKTWLVSHVNRDHLNHYPYLCDKCGELFHCKLVLRRHIIKFHEELIICEFCDEEFYGLRKLNYHSTNCQLIRRAFACKKCPATFKIKRKLNEHIKQRHSLKVICCVMCNKKFVNERKKRLHMVQAHSGSHLKKRKIIT